MKWNRTGPVCLLSLLAGLAGAARVSAGDPAGLLLRNGGFEADAFGAPPGLAAENGGLRGWEFSGRAGINPVAVQRGGKTMLVRPILDNGRIPQGRQAAFLKPNSTLRQRLPRRAGGRKWVLLYAENSAAGAPAPHLAVFLDQRLIVPDHAVGAVDPKGVFRTPFRRIVSAPFSVPAAGRPHRLIFLCSGPRRSAAGVDAVQLVPAGAGRWTPTRFPALGPRVLNGDFEADHYIHRPGYADRNGGITAWSVRGHAGINPVWSDRFRRWGPHAAFADNGRIPSGGQAAFIQSTGELRQRIAGWVPGARYRIEYYENARVTRAVPSDPVVEVRLGDRVVVSAHSVPAVDRRGRHRVPYFRVESAVFPGPASGEADLVFRTLKAGGTTVLLDGIRIEPVR